MKEKIHSIIDLCMALEDGVTHANCSISTQYNFIDVTVWEGEMKKENWLYSEHAFYDGEFKDEKALQDIIYALQELKENI